MLNSFLTTLKSNEALIDISPFGTAQQSSVYQNSEKYKAYSAISDINEAVSDFCMHTKKEEGPWWEISFTEPHYVKHIIINNRKREPFNQIASKITVKGTDENLNEIIIHEGDVTFGALPESVPMILSFYNKIKLLKITIKLSGNNYLHLGKIHILSPKNPLKELIHLEDLGRNIIFIANRTDGFGERLRAVLNVMVLANRYDGSFFFAWDDRLGHNAYHDTNQVGYIFDESFIKKHVIDKNIVDSYKLKPIHKLKEIDHESVVGFDGVLVQQGYLTSQLSKNLPDFSKEEYQKAFDKIKFSGSMVDAINSSYVEPIVENTYAIHIRAGDIVYAWCRCTNLFHSKVIPIYVIEKLIKKIITLGGKVVLFGQEDILCKTFEKKYKDVKYAGSIVESSFTNTQKAFFDINLMSRCQSIICGTSGFAVLSSWIGNTSIMSYDDFLKNDEIIDAFNEADSKDGCLNWEGVSDLLKSFSIFHFYHKFKEVLEVNKQIQLFNELIHLDTSNSYYKLILASIYYSNNMFEEGDRTILTGIFIGGPYSFEWLAKQNYDGRNMFKSFLEDLTYAENNGSLVASVLKLYYEKYQLNSLDLGHYKILLEKYDESKQGYNILKKTLSPELNS